MPPALQRPRPLCCCCYYRPPRAFVWPGLDRAPALIDEPLICPEYAFSRGASSCLAHKCESVRLQESETSSLERRRPAQSYSARFRLRVSVSEQQNKECCFKSLICSPFTHSQNANVCSGMKEGIIGSAEADVSISACKSCSDLSLLFGVDILIEKA